jgi:DNA-binding IclR family transcriptional regulator
MGTPIVQSVVKAFEVIKAFRNTSSWVTCTELCRRANLPLASGYRVLLTLEGIGVVIRAETIARLEL